MFWFSMTDVVGLPNFGSQCLVLDFHGKCGLFCLILVNMLCFGFSMMSLFALILVPNTLILTHDTFSLFSVIFFVLLYFGF